MCEIKTMKAISFISRYIKYFCIADNKYNAHSPFLYQFITEVLNQKTNDSNCEKIEQLRTKLSKSDIIVDITDFGAGSHINKSKKRKIRDIAINSAKNSKFGTLLYRIVQFYHPKSIVELGTSLGISTLYLAKANEKSQIYTFEGCPETMKIAKKNFEILNVKNIKTILGDFQNTLQKELKYIKEIDLAFIDGNHQEKATINYFEQCLIYSHNHTILIFDDIHWSKGMENAWNYIKKHKKTTLTIDLFYIGIVFIKSELSKENYIIRF